MHFALGGVFRPEIHPSSVARSAEGVKAMQ
jgi:hypothetical protein